MDSSTLAAVPAVFGLAAPLFLVFVFGWAIWRTGSRHMLVRRMWQMMLGKQEIADPVVRAFVDEQTSLMSFRWFAGISVASLDEAHQLMEWARRNGVEMRTLRLCGEYFDAGRREVRTHKVPALGWRIVNLVVLGLCVAMGIVSALGLPFNSALVTLKATQRWSLVAEGEARAIWAGADGPLQAKDCASPVKENAKRTKFTEQEVSVLCELLKDEHAPAFIKETVKEQRWALFSFLLLASWLSWEFFFTWLHAAKADELARRKLDPSIDGSQLSFDWRG